jgi:indolepyruvate ferredoxin oxidoreductase beta subunit
MKKDIILAGVGGQGILTIAATIGYAAVASNLYLKQAEVHGMSQRGGDVQSHFRLSDKPINSDLIPEGRADLIIAVEPMEALRYLPFLAPDGWLITNTTPFVNIPNYPEMEEVLAEIDKQPNRVALDADRIAKDLGAPKAANIVTLGAASKVLGMEMEALEKSLHTLFGSKGEKILNDNIAALRAGREFADKNI